MDINEIITALNNEWANDLAQAKRKIAVLQVKNDNLQKEIEELKKDEKEEDAE